MNLFSTEKRFRNIVSFVCLVGFILASSLTAHAATVPQEARQAHYNANKSKVAIYGYDPVSYFKDSPQKGKKSIEQEHGGIVYRFANETNRQTFLQSPEKYEPAYGGWCAWAMAENGDKVKVNPKTFKIINGKNYLFYDTLLADTLKLWNEALNNQEEANLIRKGDQHWTKNLTQSE